MNDQESQEDELLALASIYEDDAIYSAVTLGDGEPGDPGGQFSASPDLSHAQPFYVTFNAGPDGSEMKHQIQYLPPIVLNFQLPPDYPSTNPPTYTLSSKWLTLQQLSRLCQQLDELWEENAGDVILFTWTSFLKEDAMDFLRLSSPLDLKNVLVHKQRSRKSSTQGNLENTGNGKNKDILKKDYIDGAENDLGLTSDPRAIQDIATQELLLRTVIDYDEMQLEENFKNTLFSCNVCFTEKLGSLCIKFKGCDHVYCKGCMKDYFTVQIKDGSVKGLTCPEGKCESQAIPAQVEELVSPELFSRYDQLLLQCSLDTMADVMYCPRKHCQNPVLVERENSMGNCANCLFSFCTLCKYTYHGVAPCKVRPDEIHKLRKEYVDADAAGKLFLEKRYGKHTLNRILEESFSHEWLETNSKKCPKCGTHIEKLDGCNKMTCTKCHSYFCWLCMASISRTNPYSHFNAPGAQCYNRLFEGMDMDQNDEWFF